MALNLGTLLVKLDASTAAFEKKMKGVEAKLQKVSDKLKPIAKASSVAFVGMAGALAVVTKAANTQRQAEIQLANSIKATGQAIDPKVLQDQASALQKTTLYGDEATLAMQNFLVQTKTGQDGVVALTPLVQDMAASMGVDLKTAAQAVQKSFTMGVGSLSRYGVAFTDTEKKAFGAADKMGKVAIITEKLNGMFGGAAAAAANTGAGAFIQLQNAAGDLMEELGFLVESPLMGVLGGIKGAVAGIAKGFSDLSPGVKMFVGKMVVFGTIATGLVAAMTAMGVALPIIAAGFVTAKTAALGFATTVLPMVLTIGGILMGLILIIGAVRKAWDSDLGGIKTFTLKQIKIIKDEWIKLFDVVWKKAKNFYDSLVEGAINLKTMVTGGSPEQAYKDLQSFLGRGGDAGGGIVDGAKTAAADIKDTFNVGMGTITDGFAKIFSGFDDVAVKLAKATGTGLGAGAGGIPVGLPGGGIGGVGVNPYANHFIGHSGPGGGKPAVSGGTPIAAADINKMNEGVNMIAGSLGDAGPVIQGIMGIFTGDITAMIQAVLSLVDDLAVFGVLVRGLDGIIKIVVRVLDRFLEPLVPLIEVIVQIVAIIAQVLVMLNPFVWLWMLVGVALQKVAEAMLWVIEKVVKAFNWLIEAVAKFVGKIKKSWGNSVRQLKLDLVDMTDTVEDTTGPVKNLGTEAQKAAESLSNIPEGFKLSLARYNSEQSGSSYLTDIAKEAGVGNFFIDNMNVYSNSAEDFAGDVWDTFVENGSILNKSLIPAV